MYEFIFVQENVVKKNKIIEKGLWVFNSTHVNAIFASLILSLISVFILLNWDQFILHYLLHMIQRAREKTFPKHRIVYSFHDTNPCYSLVVET